MMRQIDEENGSEYMRCHQFASERKQESENKWLKFGRTIKLRGLDDHNWKDQEVVIVGKVALKNGNIRWPIRLKEHEKDPLLTAGYVRQTQKDKTVRIPLEAIPLIAAYADRRAADSTE